MAGRGRPKLHANQLWVMWVDRMRTQISRAEAPVEVYVTRPDGYMQMRTQGVNQHNHPLMRGAKLVGTYTAPFDSRAFLADVEATFAVTA